MQLTQEVTIFTEHDGLIAWRQAAAEIVDESRNQRRDFFVVQLVKLPARLTVGKYLLKVRIRDVNGQTLDEQTLPLQLVAEQSMASSGTK